MHLKIATGENVIQLPDGSERRETKWREVDVGSWLDWEVTDISKFISEGAEQLSIRVITKHPNTLTHLGVRVEYEDQYGVRQVGVFDTKAYVLNDSGETVDKLSAPQF